MGTAIESAERAVAGIRDRLAREADTAALERLLHELVRAEAELSLDVEVAQIVEGMTTREGMSEPEATAWAVKHLAELILRNGRLRPSR